MFFRCPGCGLEWAPTTGEDWDKHSVTCPRFVNRLEDGETLRTPEDEFVWYHKGRVELTLHGMELELAYREARKELNRDGGN